MDDAETMSIEVKINEIKSYPRNKKIGNFSKKDKKKN
jgi:hypothetical protein